MEKNLTAEAQRSRRIFPLRTLVGLGIRVVDWELRGCLVQLIESDALRGQNRSQDVPPS